MMNVPRPLERAARRTTFLPSRTVEPNNYYDSGQTGYGGDRQRPDKMARWRVFPPLLVVALLLTGLLFPTSLNGVISKELYFSAGFLLIAMLSTLLFRKNGITSRTAIVNLVFINGLLILFTLTSPLRDYAFGAALSYFLLSLVFCLNLRGIMLPSFGRVVYTLLNGLILIAGFLVVVHYEPLNVFLLGNYAVFYEDLLPLMLENGKPVLMFGSHSLAGFFFFILLVLNLKTYASKHGARFLIMPVAYLVLLFSLNSETGYCYGVVGLMYFIIVIGKTFAKILLTSIAVLIAIAICFENRNFRDYMISNIQTTAAYDMGGFEGRYSSKGTLSGNLQFISTHLLSPVGFTNSSGLMFGDSGPIEYLLRGSLPLLFAVYLGLWMYFRRNFARRRDAYQWFAIFLSFELAYSNLTYFRTLYLLPFVVVYVNTLRQMRRGARRIRPVVS